MTHATWRLHFGHIALFLANQGAGNGAADVDEAEFQISFVFAHDLIGHGVARVFAGEMSGFRLLDFPREVGPVLAVAFLLAGFWPIVAFARRPTGHTFASQWFVVGASFAFPLTYLLAQLLVLWQPASGVVQAVAHSWFVANLLQLWFGASALAAISDNIANVNTVGYKRQQAKKKG